MPSELQPGVLADELVSVTDEIRGAVHGALGTRPYRVWVVRRSWSGGRRGVGEPVDTETELLPPPRVRRSPQLEKRLRPAGPEEEGDITLTEVSLTYSEDELYPAARTENAEFFYRLDEGHGHDARPRFFVPREPPQARRGDSQRDAIDWRIELRQVEAPT